MCFNIPLLLITGGISIDGSPPKGLIKNVKTGRNLSITCSCSNPNYTTYLSEINLQDFTKKDEIDSGSVTINRIISHPVSFTCCQHDADWQCTRPLHINLTQQEEITQGMCYGLGFCY